MKGLGWKIPLIIICIIIISGAIDLGTGYFGVLRTKTVGKAQQNADRTVFESTQSYVEGKRQELVKLHHEWRLAEEADKRALESEIRISFANFDSKLIQDPELQQWLIDIKNK